jgi:hypothetical protein
MAHSSPKRAAFVDDAISLAKRLSRSRFYKLATIDTRRSRAES